MRKKVEKPLKNVNLKKLGVSFPRRIKGKERTYQQIGEKIKGLLNLNCMFVAK